MIGGGDSAMEEALFLTKFAKSVTVVHRRDTLKASKIMADRALAHEKINFIWNTAVEDVVGEAKVTGLKLKNLVDGTASDLAVTGVFVAIGNDPRTDLGEGRPRPGTGGHHRRAGPQFQDQHPRRLRCRRCR